MNPGSGSSDEVVATYIRVIHEDSPEAANTVEQILAIFGSRAALRATLVLTLLKMEVQKSHATGNIDVQTHLIQAFPAALPLLNRAVAYCLRAWGVPLVEPFTQAIDASADSDGDASQTSS